MNYRSRSLLDHVCMKLAILHIWDPSWTCFMQIEHYLLWADIEEKGHASWKSWQAIWKWPLLIFGVACDVEEVYYMSTRDRVTIWNHTHEGIHYHSHLCKQLPLITSIWLLGNPIIKELLQLRDKVSHIINLRRLYV